MISSWPSTVERHEKMRAVLETAIRNREFIVSPGSATPAPTTTQVLETYASLNAAILEAGGSGQVLETMLRGSFVEAFETMARNNIRFSHKAGK